VALTATALSEVLANGTTYYVALGTTADIMAETIVELDDPTYARKGHSDWVTDTSTGAIWRKNNSAIVFDPVTNTLTGVAWWAIFTEAVGGDMIAAGLILNLDGAPQPATLDAGDEFRFNEGALRLVATPEAP
jgi:hypothetical protein